MTRFLHARRRKKKHKHQKRKKEKNAAKNLGHLKVFAILSQLAKRKKKEENFFFLYKSSDMPSLPWLK